MIDQTFAKRPHVGHFLFVFGAFLMLVSLTLLAPLNKISQAFGTSDIINLSNQAREQFSKAPLSSNYRLMNGAQMKADDMAKGHYFAHTAPDGTVAWDYMKKVGYSYEVAGENLAITNENAEAVIDGWLNSPTHRDNLLSGDYKDFGIGMAFFGDYEGHKNTYVVVAFYAKSASVQDVAAPTSPAGTSTFFKPNISNIPPPAIALFTGLLMVIGGTLEIRHIKRLHHAPSL